MVTEKAIARKMFAPEITDKPERILCPETVSTRKLPANFDDADINLFRHELKVLIPQTQLLALADVNISSDGIIFRRNRILAESFNYRHEFRSWANPRNLVKFLARNYGCRTRKQYDSQALWITDNWGNAYFHWLTDALPRLYVIRDRLTDSTLLLPESCRNSQYVASSLAAFNINKVDYIDPLEVVHCRKLLVPSHTAPSGNYNEGIVRGLRQLYWNYYNKPDRDAWSGKVYISRAKARRRRIINEEEVIGVVKEYGFSVFTFEDYSFEEQVKIMLTARFVVANHGAGLANMLFLSEKSQVLELRKRNDSRNNCYFALASGLNLEYYYQLCRTEDQGSDEGWANIVVDVKELRRNLLRMLGSEYV
jgi:hypothetical protein